MVRILQFEKYWRLGQNFPAGVPGGAGEWEGVTGRLCKFSSVFREARGDCRSWSPPPTPGGLYREHLLHPPLCAWQKEAGAPAEMK